MAEAVVMTRPRLGCVWETPPQLSEVGVVARPSPSAPPTAERNQAGADGNEEACV